MLAATPPHVTDIDLARLAHALITAANAEATFTVTITPSLTEYYRAPDLQTVHDIGKYHLPALEHLLRAWGLPEVTYDGDCFRFDHN
ncbi:MAG TPA: hypothetical protein VD978_16160 [Azospirillum sp.]|nr:hypothetical protein [Azospirillum sp.]